MPIRYQRVNTLIPRIWIGQPDWILSGIPGDGEITLYKEETGAVERN